MSDKNKSTFGLRLDQLADLFGLVTEGDVSEEINGSIGRQAERLRQQLNEVMPGKSLLLTAVSEISASEKCDLTAMTGRSLLQVLTNPESSVSQLRMIKDAGKSLSSAVVSEEERAAANTVYHAAIASCLVHHDTKITQHSYDKLDESFAILIEKDWMTPELVELFSQAQNICQTKGVEK